uniref:Inositol 1,4,5-trisphosphate/ryanodine receptor domain-containing protein n=1 Tax=Prolemur simus TaxID=1328070 RepID=A0A8C9DQL2_PROSS
MGAGGREPPLISVQHACPPRSSIYLAGASGVPRGLRPQPTRLACRPPPLFPDLSPVPSGLDSMGDAEGEDEVQFLRTDDEVVLQCSATVLKEQLKLCLAAEGFGNRLCFLEPTSNAQNVPPDLAICCFILEQSLSVRALQEMLANTVEAGVESSQGGGHRTLLYGHAILLRHAHSRMVSTWARGCGWGQGVQCLAEEG